MKTNLLLPLLFCFSSFLNAQNGSRNLIPNAGFEDVNICTKYSEPCCPEAWRSATLKAFYYRDDEKSRSDMTKAFEGHRYVSICMHNSKRAFDRRFIQTRLLCPLEEGITYELSFQIRSLSKMVDKFGVCFFDSLPNQRTNQFLEGKIPDILIKHDSPPKLGEWTTIRASYKAKGGEQVIMVGNFNSDHQTEVTSLTKKGQNHYSIHPNSVYYHLDNFSLMPPKELNLCDLEQNHFRIYNDDVRHSKPKNTLPELEISETKIKEKVETPPAQKEYILIEEDSIEVSENFELPNILFDYNSDRLLPISYPSLKKLASFLIQNRKHQIQITGHTDSDGERYFNQELSEKRAKAVKEYLMREGVRHSRLIDEGKGEDEPITTNETEEGKAKNRRVIFKLITAD